MFDSTASETNLRPLSHPATRAAAWTQLGIASWYVPQPAGRKTASGEPYEPTALTAAHCTLPLNTLVRVTNLSSHRETIVRINDRGPFIRAESSIFPGRRQGARRLAPRHCQSEAGGGGGPSADRDRRALVHPDRSPPETNRRAGLEGEGDGAVSAHPVCWSSRVRPATGCACG